MASNKKDTELCRQFKKIHVTKPKNRAKSAPRSGRIKDRTTTDLSYNGGGRSVGSCMHTSKWDTVILGSVGIYYNDYSNSVPEILNMVYESTGQFGPLTEEQKLSVKSVQNSINFSYSIADVSVFSAFKFTGIFPDLIEITKKDLKGDSTSNSHVEDFIRSTVAMIQIMKSRRTVPEVVFVDIFKIFVKMSGLNPSPGEAWQSEMKILQHRVQSTADVVITRDFLDAVSLEAVSVVSIVEVKNMTSDRAEHEYHECRKTEPSRSSGSSNLESNTDSADLDGAASEYEVPLHEEPAIFKTMDKNVLGQHGGELLIHFDSYGNEFKEDCTSYQPGMIVIGTKVTLTLLVCSFEHIEEFTKKSVVEKERSIIYYSEPKDLLKKEDRDLLLESFVRMSNAASANQQKNESKSYIVKDKHLCD